MANTEIRLSPEPRERLGPSQVLLFPNPGFLMSNVRYATFQAIYSRYINPSERPPEDIPEDAMPKVIEYIADNLDEFNETFAEEERIVIPEYDGLFTSIRDAVGRSRIRMIAYPNSRPEENPFLAATQQRAAAYNEQVTDMQSITFHSAAPFQCFPRDMFTQFGQYVFVNSHPFAFPRFQETKFYRKSPFGEGGMMVQSQKAVIFCDDILRKRSASKDLKILEQLGYKVGLVPRIRPNRQATDKRFFSDYHIDGHCSLITGKDNKLYFLFARSYIVQDRPTYRAIVNACKKVGARPVLVDDSRQTHMGFNFVQLTDGTVIYPLTGSMDGENYRPSNLDGALIEIVGLENVVMTRELNHIPRLTRAGLRCMTNIASSNFVDHLVQTTTLSLPDLEL